MNKSGRNMIDDEVKEAVRKRFYSGDTNISVLSEEFNLSRNTVRGIVKNDPVRYERTIACVRQKNADREKKRKNEAAKRCRQQRRGKDQDERSRTICEYFWRMKCVDDDYGRYSEYKTAERFGISLQDVVETLRTDPRYSELEKYREEVIEKKMLELQEQNAVSMSKRTCLSPEQAVMLNRNAYDLSQDGKRFTYSLKKWAVRPADLPQSISASWINLAKEAKDKTKAEEWNSETEQQAIGNDDKPVPPGGGKKKKKKHRHKKK